MAMRCPQRHGVNSLLFRARHTIVTKQTRFRNTADADLGCAMQLPNQSAESRTENDKIPDYMKPYLKHLFTAGALLGAVATTPAQMLINGAGATFPYPIYSKWFDEYAKVDPSVRFNYQSIGSGGGQKQILAQTVDFGASDGPMSDDNLAKAPGKILHIPTVAGADVVAYNLPGNPALKLGGETVGEICLATVKKWK